jgi:hypothetical protein
MVLTTETNCKLIYFIVLDNFTFCANFKIIDILNFIVNLSLCELRKLF